jgi:hypothetical protein
VNDPDPLRRDLDRLRRKNKWCPLTPEEAEAELKAAPDEPFDEDEIAALVGLVRSGQIEPTPPEPELWTGDEQLDEVEEDVLQLNRNAGERDEQTDRLIDELRRKALDNDGKEQYRQDGGASPPGASG